MDIDPERLWQAIEACDTRFDGWVFCGVTSTGSYCRPSCPARTPRRRNARFFASAAAAQAAGFHACKRCRPDASPGSPEWDTRADLVAGCGERLERPLGSVTHVFPTAAALAGDAGEGVAMPATRRRALTALARALARGGVRGGSRGARGGPRGAQGGSRRTQGGSRGARGGSRGTQGGSRGTQGGSRGAQGGSRGAQPQGLAA